MYHTFIRYLLDPRFYVDSTSGGEKIPSSHSHPVLLDLEGIETRVTQLIQHQMKERSGQDLPVWVPLGFMKNMWANMFLNWYELIWLYIYIYIIRIFHVHQCELMPIHVIITEKSQQQSRNNLTCKLKSDERTEPRRSSDTKQRLDSQTALPHCAAFQFVPSLSSRWNQAGQRKGRTTRTMTAVQLEEIDCCMLK